MLLPGPAQSTLLLRLGVCDLHMLFVSCPIFCFRERHNYWCFVEVILLEWGGLQARGDDGWAADLGCIYWYGTRLAWPKGMAYSSAFRHVNKERPGRACLYQIVMRQQWMEPIRDGSNTEE